MLIRMGRALVVQLDSMCQPLALGLIGRACVLLVSPCLALTLRFISLLVEAQWLAGPWHARDGSATFPLCQVCLPLSHPSSYHPHEVRWVMVMVEVGVDGWRGVTG